MGERRLSSSVNGRPRCALRLGLRQVTGVAEDDMKRLVERRGTQPYRDPVDLWRRSGIGKRQIIALARADAFASLGLSRRDVLWAVRGLSDSALPLLDGGPQELRNLEPSVDLPALTLGEQVVDDYAAISMTLRAHPLALLRARLAERDVAPTEALKTCSNGDLFTLAGLVLVRQRPGTASGVVFVTIEDEHGIANLVVWPAVFERYRRVVMGARLLAVRGRIQREGLVIHLVAEELWDWSADLDSISEIDGFRLAHGRGDQAHSSSPDQRDQPKPKPAKPPVRKRGYDRSQIALDRPRIKIASRDFH
jgi:error-prone DNA polymerase